MSTKSNIDDDIIELTEIVEEGESSSFSSNTFPGNEEIDFAGLGEELNDPLMGTRPTDPVGGPETPFSASSRPSVAASSDTDLDYLDDMLTSLHPAQAPEAATSLDVLLGGDIHLDLPGMPSAPSGAESSPAEPPAAKTPPAPNATGKEQDPLSGSFEIRLGSLDSASVSNRAPFDLSIEDLDFSLPVNEDNEHNPPADLPGAPLPEIHHPETAETLPVPEAQEPGENKNFKEATTADLEIISARLDVLEGWAAGSEGVALVRRQILAALPENPEELPFAVTLRENILEETGRLIEAKAQGEVPQVEELRRLLDAFSARLETLESRPVESGVGTEQILAALPENSEALPFAASLRADILEETGRLTEEKIRSGATLQMEELRQTLNALSARFGSLESRVAEPVHIGTEQILAALPDNPGTLPFAAALRTEILEEAGRRLTAEVKAQDNPAVARVEELRQTLNTLSARFGSLESRVAEPVHIGTEQVLAALPESPDTLPFAAALRTEILEEAGRRLTAEVKAVPSAARVEELHQALNALSARVETLESRVAEPVHIGTEQVLAALPDNPGDLPFSANLRSDILEEMDERVSISVASVDDLFQAMNALEERVTSLNESQDRMASTQIATSVQEFEAELSALRETIRSQEDALLGLQAAFEAKEAEIAALRESEDRLLRKLDESVQAQEDGRNALEEDLRNFVREQIPDAAAKIIREEIQNLLRDMGA